MLTKRRFKYLRYAIVFVIVFIGFIIATRNNTWSESTTESVQPSQTAGDASTSNVNEAGSSDVSAASGPEAEASGQINAGGSGISLGGIGGVPSFEREEEKITITKEVFDSIYYGMTYEQVTGMIGGPGEIISEKNDGGDQQSSVMYLYHGNTSGSSAIFRFKDGVLKLKTQMGLE